MKPAEDLFKNVVSHAKEYGFIFQSSEIYDGLSAVYDYAQLGVLLKNNIRTYWWEAMVRLHENIVGLDAAILMHPTTWKASGHVDAFNKEQFLATNGRVIEIRERSEAIIKRMSKSLEEENLADVKALIEELEIACPV